MATANDALNELNGADKLELHKGRPTASGGTEWTTRVRRAVHAAAFELTLWMPRRPLKTLRGKQGGVDTALGHAIDSASYGAINTELLIALAKKQGVDVAKVLAPFGGE